MDKFPHVNTDVLIIKDEQVLLGMPSEKWLQGKEKLYGLPGDDIRFQETIEAAVMRNLQDLFDAKLTSMTILGVHENFAFGNHYIGIGCLAAVNGALNLDKPSEDWEKWMWVSLDSLPKNLFEPVKATIEKYHKYKQKVY